MAKDRERETAREGQVKLIREKIDEGWAEAERGDLVDGEEFFRNLGKGKSR